MALITDRRQEIAETKWFSWCNSPEGIESHRWTTIQRCLDGLATEEEYCSLDCDYTDGVHAVGPSFGPVSIARC